MPPVKVCIDCSSRISIVSTRCRRCENVFRADKIKWPTGEAHHAWKGNFATDLVKRKRARRRFQLGPCSRCGKMGTDRHHRDGDPGNNDSHNIEILCRRCHMESDGRLLKLKQQQLINSLRIKPPTACVVCQRLSKPLRRGLCHACNERLRRHSAKTAARDGGFGNPCLK